MTDTAVITNEYAVVRFDTDVPIGLRRHRITQGEVQGRWSDYDAAMAYIDSLADSVQALLHVEERTEEWEVECSCESEVMDDDGKTIHYEECAIIQAAAVEPATEEAHHG